MNTDQKLAILADSAKYDASCASSGSTRRGTTGMCSQGGICHSWTSDGRCVSLLKLLFSNECVYDCAYCVNRRSNDRPRSTFEVSELVDLTMSFYRRNYIEGLFLSSGVWESPDTTMTCLCRVAEELRLKHSFGGYIHLKAIPGCDPELLRRAGRFADRMSINIELPSQKSLTALAPQKNKTRILKPMGLIGREICESRAERKVLRHAPLFAPAGQSTQLIVGASPETDRQILCLSESLYRSYDLRRVYYSAYVPVNDDSRLPALREPPLLREHRLYQADWLLRFYGFQAEELLSTEQPGLDIDLDPKTAWALRNPQIFPIEINRASYESLLRVPGIGVSSARKILAARRYSSLTLEDLGKLGAVVKRAQFFVTAGGRYVSSRPPTRERLRYCLLTGNVRGLEGFWQPELFPMGGSARAAYDL